MEKTKPCPFCGGTDIDTSFSFGYKGGDESKPINGVGCMDCGASAEGKETETEAIAAWNLRVNGKD